MNFFKKTFSSQVSPQVNKVFPLLPEFLLLKDKPLKLLKTQIEGMKFIFPFLNEQKSFLEGEKVLGNILKGYLGFSLASSTKHITKVISKIDKNRRFCLLDASVHIIGDFDEVFSDLHKLGYSFFFELLAPFTVLISLSKLYLNGKKIHSKIFIIDQVQNKQDIYLSIAKNISSGLCHTIKCFRYFYATQLTLGISILFMTIKQITAIWDDIHKRIDLGKKSKHLFI